MKRYTNIILAFAIALLAAGCSREVPLDGGTDPMNQGGAEVRVVVRSPDPADPSTRVANTEFENSIENVSVLVLEETAGVMRLVDVITGFQVREINSTESSFTIPITASEAEIKLIILANCSVSFPFSDSDIVETLQSEGLDDEEVIRSMLGDVLANVVAPTLGDPLMPMGAQVSLGVVEPLERIEIDVPLIRAVARADLFLNLGEGSGTFVPEEIYVYNAQPIYVMVADEEAFSSDAMDRVIAPTPPPGSPNNYRFQGVVDPVNVTTGIFSTLYVSENVKATTDQEKLEAPCIVVGGYYNGSSDLSYYRVDFNSGMTGHPFGQILRNWQYQFYITNVSAPGYDTPQEAADNIPKSITLDVVPWSSQAAEIRFPDSGNYITLSERDLVLPYEALSEGSIEITSTLPFTLALEDQTIYSTAVDMAGIVGITISNSLFSFTVVRTAYDGSLQLPESRYLIEITALTDNVSGTNAARLILAVGNGTLDIDVSQNVDPTYIPPRTLHVHSLVNYYGAMGSTYPTNVGTYLGDADAMREMLLNTANFGPEGTGKVVLDEIVFTLGATTDVDNDSHAEELTVTLESANVLIVPGYGLTTSLVPSPACIEVILEWAQDPTHILIMTVDDSPNSNLALQAALPYQLAWDDSTTNLDTFLGNLIGDLGIGTRDYTYGSPTDSSSADDGVFMNGPFGAVDRDAFFEVSDTIRSFVDVSTLPANVIPIVSVSCYYSILSALGSYAELDAMLVGVDTMNRIVWMGESQIGSDTNMGADAELQKLMGNLWAWIVDTANP